ncbi:MAG: erythromycin esterase family protein [Nitriliruptor sp.]|nr:MAG: erythromycin esterase family protein [Nitriliruptor sp.]
MNGARGVATDRRSTLTADVLETALPLEDPGHLDPLIERIGQSRFVLIGEASHGTHEYYAWRAELTRRLLAEQGFSFVAVEGDWPDCARLDRWVRGEDGRSAGDVLRTFERWPTWMWANREVEAFLTWLRGWNAEHPPGERAGFHGLDVYSLWQSLRTVMDHLEVHDGEAAATARRAWSCLEPYDEDPQQYALATRVVPSSCEDEVVDLLQRLLRNDVPADGDGEVRFDVEQNAVVAANAERYYRAMVRGGTSSWNVRDVHMADTLDRLIEHYGPDAKAIVWEHNTHIGDARATDMAAAGMVNVGQLVRERHLDEGVVLVGAGSHRGSVIAAPGWGEPFEEMPVPPARPGSHEHLLHEVGLEQHLFVFPDRPTAWLEAWLDHRAIGVVYRPQLERAGNYVPTALGRRYDAFWYFDRTRALRPLMPEEPQPDDELETYPFGT